MVEQPVHRVDSNKYSYFTRFILRANDVVSLVGGDMPISSKVCMRVFFDLKTCQFRPPEILARV